MSTNNFKPNSAVITRHLKGRLSANGTVVLPAFGSIKGIRFANRTENAVTGGLRVGTSTGGNDVLAATSLGPRGISDTTPNTTGATTVQSTPTPLFIQAVTAWNNAVVDYVIEYQYVKNTETEYAPGSLNLGNEVGKAHSSQ